MSGPTFWTEEQQARRVPVWVWVFGPFVCLLILMLWATPFHGRGKDSNETSAINSLQAIVKAEVQYADSFPANGYACKLSNLGGDPGNGPPTPQAAQLIQADLASGFRSGYIFKIATCTKVKVNGIDRITGFTVTAVPQVPGKTGNRGFCIDETGAVPKYDPKGGTNCTEQLQ